jgi:small-conductance mechanosensitive channel
MCGAMLKRLLLTIFLVLAGILPVHAQSAAPAAPAAAPAPAPAAVSPAELERLVGSLQDDAQRARLVEQLRGLIAAQRVAEPEAPGDPASVLGKLSVRLDAVTQEILGAANTVVDLPRLFAWAKGQMGDFEARQRWLDAALKLAIVFGFALFAEWVVRRLLQGPRRRLDAHVSQSLVARVALQALRTLFEALPILAFAIVAYSVLPMTSPRYATEKVATIFIHANVIGRIVVAVARTFLLPHGVASLLGLGEETRTYLLIWVRRFTNVAVYGYAIAEGGWWFGVPGYIYALVLKATGLVIAILSIIFVLQNRTAVAEWLRGRQPAEPSGRRSGWVVVRNRVADVWHVLAIVYLLGIFLVYALRIEGGFFYIVRATLVSLVVVIAARLIVGLARRASRHGFAISPELKAKFPTLETRANRYLPIMTAAVSAIVYLLAALTILQAWDIESFAWFGSPFGRRVVSGAISLGTVLIVALVVWELFSSAIERYLTAVDPEGNPLPRSARARTLLPLFRTAMMVLLVVMVSLITLSELGVNIAPLLAGAGVVGIAIGFGSQALVKDVITGLFILIEDTLAVGDVVDIGKGHSGVVESITIRTIRLRDSAGTLHTVPFSEVQTVKNLTRDYAYFVANVAVSYREDPDRAIEVIREVGAELARDADLGPYIAAPLELLGVDKLADNGMVIQARIKTLPLKQWSVGREFNRRLKKAFDRAGLEMPYTVQPKYVEQLQQEHPVAEPRRIKTA